MTINKDLLDILACPKCKGDIHLNETGDGLICDACRLMYPIKDDIPIMLIDEATAVDDAEHERLLALADERGITASGPAADS